MKIVDYHNVLSELKKIIQQTKYEGHLFAVGGCVRDSIMFSKDIKDVDLVVDLPNGGVDFAEWLNNNDYLTHEPVIYPTYGTAMFKLKSMPTIELEVVETRKEQYKDKNSRNPQVKYGTLIEDCLRRDLTINALYQDISNGEIIDLINGQYDIKHHIIRTPSNPDVVFNDDPLRMLRVCRFSTRYGWCIQDETLDGIKRNAYRLNIITQERITDEMIKTLTGALHTSKVIGLWSECGLLDIILYPNINGNTVLLRQLNYISLYYNKPEFFFAALFRECPQMLSKYKLSNQFVDTVNKLNDCLKWVNVEITDNNVRKFGKEYGRLYIDCLNYLGSYCFAYLSDASANGMLSWHERFCAVVDFLEKEGSMFNENTKLPIDGNDIMEMFNIGQSKQVCDYLKYAWEIYYTYANISKDELKKILIKDLGKVQEDGNILKKKLYLSGPMSICKTEEIWKQNFQKYEDIFTAKGYEVINPAKNAILPTYEECLKHSLKQEMECDCIFFMDNAILSNGARLEYEIAKACSLEIVLLNDELSFDNNYANNSGIKPKND